MRVVIRLTAAVAVLYSSILGHFCWKQCLVCGEFTLKRRQLYFRWGFCRLSKYFGPKLFIKNNISLLSCHVISAYEEISFCLVELFT